MKLSQNQNFTWWGFPGNQEMEENTNLNPGCFSTEAGCSRQQSQKTYNEAHDQNLFLHLSRVFLCACESLSITVSVSVVKLVRNGQETWFCLE